MKKLVIIIITIIILLISLSFFVEAKTNQKEVEKLNVEQINNLDNVYKNLGIFHHTIVKNIIEQKIEYAEEITVLNYHFFYSKSYPNCNEIYCLDIDIFKEHLNYLKENNFNIITIEEFKSWMYKEIELPKNSILITIDDGACGTSFINGNLLIPVLEEYQVPATLFLITAWWDPSNYKSDYLSIESHGYDIHKDGYCGGKQIDCLTNQELKEDLDKSISILNSNIAFAYPFFHSTENSKDVLEEIFSIAFVGGNRKANREDDKYLIPRYEVLSYTTMEEFINMVN